MLKTITTAILSLCIISQAQAISGPELAKRQCRSVHLGYKKSVNDPSYAYIDLKVDKSAPGTYFCALGFHMGYLGMQELPNGKKVVIFSIWEPNHGQNPKAVPEDRRTKLIRKGEGVRTGRFGNEGTGGQSFYNYDWKVGESVSFLVKSQRINDAATRYTGYFFNNQSQQWQLMTEFQTLAKGKQLGNGIYSFVEDFRRNYESAKISRRAQYLNAYASADGKTWKPMTNARFTADNTPSENVDAGPVKQGFFLQTGGETTQTTTKLWQGMETNTVPQTAMKPLPKEIQDSLK
ncbi:DUF3472 domain-containing protein [Rubritalea tangerina]|uniref:DUF3472 domain-containing protein n=2 Tax=Rubritalea tangerina TaxID=430798 RepID=A0ABW4Z7C2_9BACT